MPPHSLESPAKKQSKWSPDEDALIIELRGSGMKWDDISKKLPGRSAISCRLHYQNYLERRSEWDEERKNKLARLYERFKSEMWAKIAEEMSVPWRAAEAMHWQLGEQDMARRAGVTPFSLSGMPTELPPGHHRQPLLAQGLAQTHPHAGVPSPLGAPMHGHRPRSGPMTQYQQHVQPRGPSTRSIAARRDSVPRSVPPRSPGENLVLAGIRPPAISSGWNGGPSLLPSVTEMVTRVSPYSTPAYTAASSMGGNYAGQGPLLPAIGYWEGTGPGSGPGPGPGPGPRPQGPSQDGKSSRSPENGRDRRH